MRRVPLANQPGWDGSRSSTSGRREQIGIRAFVVNQLVVIMGLFIALVLLDLINILAVTHASAYVAGKLFCASRSRAPIPWFSSAYPLQMPRKKSRRADSNRLPLLITSDHSRVAGVCRGSQGHGEQPSGVPHSRLRSDLDHALSAPVPVSQTLFENSGANGAKSRIIGVDRVRISITSFSGDW